MRSIFPLFLAKGFIAVVPLVQIGIVDILIPLFRASVGPQEKEPPDSFF
jgi:hypothetical protein